MKCESNKIGSWLDGVQLKSSHMDDEENWGPVDWVSYYDGAIECLKVAGFKVDVVPCGRGMIHIVNPPDKIVRLNDNGQMELGV